MTQNEVIYVHSLIDKEEPTTYVEAANIMLEIMRSPERVDNPEKAIQAMGTAFFGWLEGDQYELAALLAWGNKLFNPKPRAVKIVWGAMEKRNKVLALGGSAQAKTYSASARTFLRWVRDPKHTTVKLISTTGGHAKCFGIGTLVRLWNGATKAVEHLEVGDVLMGPDSQPREIIETHSGEDDLFRVKPLRTEGFICNGEHLLHLEKLFGRYGWNEPIRTIPAKDYNSKSKTFKEEFKMVRAGYELPAKPQPFDPYIVGLWLGDGHTGCPAITNMDRPIIDRWCSYFKGLGYTIKIYNEHRRAKSYYARVGRKGFKWGQPRNLFTHFIKTKCSFNGKKRIPSIILQSSMEHRLACLAGLIDSDGSQNQRGYLITTSLPGLRDDILDLCASLGFHAKAHPFVSRSQGGRTHGTNWSIRIRGFCEQVPVLLERKKCMPTETNQRFVSFTVEPVGRGEFYGFQVNEDGLFLLSNGLVAHNSNIYSTFVRFHRESIIPMPGEVRQNYIGLDPNDLHSAICKVSIQPGETGEAALRGFHPLPRGYYHPTFGEMSCSIALLDEADGIPTGAWKGVDNISATPNVWVYAATNPTKQNGEFGIRAEPLDGGWGEWDRENSVEWEGQQGWWVVRLDPAKSENVMEREMIYDGFMDYPGFLTYEAKGTQHPDYDVYARGRYPSSTAQYNVIPSNILNIVVGDVNFIGSVENWGSFDGGYALGGDAAILTTGRYGLCDSFMNKKGELFEFAPKMIAIAEQQFEIERVLKDGEPNSILMGDELIEIMTRLHVRPEYFVMDKTGNGLGVYDYLRLAYGNILGVEWGEAATNLKILEEDSKTAEEQFYMIRTEMWFGCSIWMEYGNFKISPRMQTQKLFAQLGNRKYTYHSKTLRLVESKADYKKNNREQSPNEADSLIMVPQLLRTRTEGRPSMDLPPKRPKRSLWDDLRRSSPEQSEPRPAWVDV